MPRLVDDLESREHNENMSRSVPNLIDLIGRMEMREQRGFGISPETAPLVIEALRLYAQ